MRFRYVGSHAASSAAPSTTWHITKGKCVAQTHLAIIPRIATVRLTQLLGQFPAVALLGPRQVRETTLALSLTNGAQNLPLYLDLELPSNRAKLADPELYLSDYEDRLVILDEIHRLPGIFQTLA